MTPETRFIKRPAARADWLAARRGYVGGSEVAALLGLSPWRTAVDVFLDKSGRGPADDPDPSEALRLGSFLEQYAAGRYTETTGRAVRNYGYMVVRGHALADVDRLIVPDGASVAAFHEDIRTDGILECKTSGADWGDDIPEHYQAQGQLYAELLDCAFVDFAVVFLAPRRAFRVYRLDRDREIGARLVAAVERFWTECMVPDEPPSCATLADVRALYPRGGMEPRAASPEVAADVRRLRTVAAARADLEREEDEIKGRVAAYMGDADALTVDGRTVATFKAPKPTDKTDWKAVAEDIALAAHVPGDEVTRIVGKHRTLVEPARRFLLKPAKDAAQ